MSRSLPALLLGFAVFMLDQVSKGMALNHLEWGQPVEIIPGFFNLVLIYNKGAAWGILRDQGWGLTLLAFVALVFLLAIRRHFTHVGRTPRIALGLLIGGISGNLMDRLLYGHVIDFLSFYIGKFQWPAFNVADSAICIGVGLYLFDSTRRNHAAANSNSVQPGPG